jgi:5S rRNA maturation endonuclease (ribonuclease M5)
MEYKEVTSKRGQVLVFCKFEDLLKEAYNVTTMEEVETHKNQNDEYICHCPFCKAAGHKKHKLYIKSDLTVGHCFVCTRAFVNVTDTVDVTFPVPTFNNFGMMTGGTVNLVRLTDPNWTIDKYYTEFDDYSEEGVAYLKNRHIYLGELYKALDFKFLDGNIVMPFKYHGEIFYYQIRFSGNSKLRYFFPPISAKPPYIIERGNNKKFIICEGVYDAISLLIQAPDYTPFAVLGSSISDYQIDFLREYVPEEILIYMDETRISQGIANKLSRIVDYCPIRIIKSNGEDPEEKMKRLMSYGKSFNELAWIK